MNVKCIHLNFDNFYYYLPYTTLAAAFAILLPFLVATWLINKLDAIRRRIDDMPQKSK